MQVKSIEPTPSPNSMKLNIEPALPQGVTYNINPQNKHEAPAYIQQIMEVEGVKGVYQVSDFMAVERHPKADWKVILPQVRAVFDEHDAGEEGRAAASDEEPAQVQDTYGEIEVYFQMFKGIPMQIKLQQGDEEHRVGLPERFMAAAMKAQPSADNLVLERKWVEKGVRYGDVDEVGEQLVEELNAAYDEERIDRLVAKAFQEEQDVDPDEAFSAARVQEALQDEDWKTRYAALERMRLTEDEIPILEQALQDSKMSIRRLATAYLGEVGGKKVLPLLYSALEDKSPVVRRTAGDAISDVGDPEAMPVMIKALQDPNKLVRWRAARYMYEVGTEEALPALQEAEQDPEFEVSLQVKMALERIEGGEEAEGTVWQQMTRKMNEES
ncbi:conserved virulence factor C family protein [Caldalkalibacillus salinus]|uniref:conserved virulence factor C family protein n=1 Tax=Caldalkalibacillus salinus TaxID=2803787 RepID=UPI001921ED08|nr:conserved virulence factor C family protein [Caldalkalibacillus salinus]